MIFSEHMQGQLLLSEMNVENSLLVSDSAHTSPDTVKHKLCMNKKKNTFLTFDFQVGISLISHLLASGIIGGNYVFMTQTYNTEIVFFLLFEFQLYKNLNEIRI